MAIYHLTAQIIGRSKGKSAVAAAAYRAAETLYSQQQDVLFDYARKGGVVFSEILLPTHVPLWMGEREKLWNAVELFEKRKDASYAREIEVSLPVELSIEQQKALLRDYLNEAFVNRGMIADYSIHEVDTHNPHAHIMLTLRPVVGDSFGNKAREWNDKNLFIEWREQWAVFSNQHLALAGSDKKISHLSHADQKIDLEPTMHRGYMSRKNAAILDRFQKAKAIKERNYERLLVNPEIAIDLLTCYESIFSHHDLARFVNERTDSPEEFTNLKIAIETNAYLVSLGQGIDGKEYYTSKTVLKNEHDLIERAGRLAQSNMHQLNPKKFDFVLAERTLNTEQEAAFNHILSGKDLSLVVGFAGTGKSYLMDAVREAYESHGYRVMGAALAGRAADGLAQSARINSRTIARFLIDWENGRESLTDKTVLIVDEAGMVGSRQMQALLFEAERAGSKVILCGDPEQIPSVEAGCPFRFLLERTQHTSLRSVVRQKIEWQRQATVELSTQQHGKAIDRYLEHGHIYDHSSRAEAMKAIVDRWAAWSSENQAQSAVMMSYRNADVLSMNLMARECLQGLGQLTEKAFHISTKAFGELEFAVGDRLMFLRNEKSINVKNGLLGRIEDISGSFITVKMDRGDILSFDTAFYNDLGYGYASTVHKLQGETVDKSFVLATPQFNRFIANVALDRHRDDIEIHYGLDDFKTYDNLKRILSRGESKILAVEYAQARGTDYESLIDVAAEVESKKDFTNYYNEIISESSPIKNTLAEIYLKKQGIENVDVSSIRFHPAVWERETQIYSPALVARAVGEGSKGFETKGVQITFLDKDGNKATIEHPVRYSGSPDAIIMLQKPAKQNSRWYVAADIETALAVVKAKPDARVACLATQERFNHAPLHGNNQKELVFCSGETSRQDLVQRAASVFSKKGFMVRVTQPILKKNTLDSIRKTVENSTLVRVVDRGDKELGEEIEL